MAALSHITRRSVLSSIALVSAAGTIIPEQADVELLALAAELDMWMARDLDKTLPDGEWDAAYAKSAELADKIEKMPAKTVAGLRAKAKAIAWCHCGDTVDLRLDQDTRDLRLANQIVEFLLNTREG